MDASTQTHSAAPQGRRRCVHEMHKKILLFYLLFTLVHDVVAEDF